MLTSFDSSSMTVPSLVDRRASDTSTASTLSTQHTPNNETHMPTYTGASNAQSSRVPSAQGQTYSDGSARWPHQPVRSPRIAPEQPVTFGPVSWEHLPTPNPLSQWIDLDAIFQSTEETCNEPFAEFAVPMWTR
jgi:hypothetical protein